AARVVAELHLTDRDIAQLTTAREERYGDNQLADQSAAKVRVAMHRATHCSGSAGPGFETGEPVAECPADQAVDGDATVRANPVFCNPDHAATVKADDEAAD